MNQEALEQTKLNTIRLKQELASSLEVQAKLSGELIEEAVVNLETKLGLLEPEYKHKLIATLCKSWLAQGYLELSHTLETKIDAHDERSEADSDAKLFSGLELVLESHQHAEGY